MGISRKLFLIVPGYRNREVLINFLICHDSSWSLIYIIKFTPKLIIYISVGDRSWQFRKLINSLIYPILGISRKFFLIGPGYRNREVLISFLICHDISRSLICIIEFIPKLIIYISVGDRSWQTRKLINILIYPILGISRKLFLIVPGYRNWEVLINFLICHDSSWTLIYIIKFTPKLIIYISVGDRSWQTRKLINILIYPILGISRKFFLIVPGYRNWEVLISFLICHDSSRSLICIIKFIPKLIIYISVGDRSWQTRKLINSLIYPILGISRKLFLIVPKINNIYQRWWWVMTI